MPLDQIANIAEILAAALVIVSLLYVGLQVRQHTTASRATAAQANVSAVNEYVGLINASDKLADILQQGGNGLSSLKGGDLIRFNAWHDQAFMAIESQYLQWKDGALDERLWLSRRQAALMLLAQPGQQEWWATRRDWYFPEFRDYLDNLVATEKSKPMHPGAVAG